MTEELDGSCMVDAAIEAFGSFRQADGDKDGSRDTGDSPDLAGVSPDLADDSPDLAGVSPDLADDSPDLADDSPDLADDSHDLAGDRADDVPEVSRKVTSRGRRNRPRSKTIALKRLTRAELLRGAEMYPPVEDVDRPRTRDDCRDAPRPCPWVACKHHLYLDINPRTGSIKINFPDLEPWELDHTCSLDIADAGGLTLEEIGVVTNLTRERVRQVEVRGLLTLQARSTALR